MIDRIVDAGTPVETCSSRTQLWWRIPSTSRSAREHQPQALSSTLATQFIESWAYTQKIRSAGLPPSSGTAGEAQDNATMESFWSSTQIDY